MTSQNRWVRVAYGIGGLVLGFLLAAGTFSFGTFPEGGAGGTNAAAFDASRSASSSRTDLAAEERRAIVAIDSASRSVVNISTSSLREGFFSRNVFEIPKGNGTGFVWDKQGHIVTNYHVIHGANRFTVKLWDRSTYSAELVWNRSESLYPGYPDKDLAVLKIDAPASRLHPITLGDSKKLLVGQTVLAIGNPFGLDQTVTKGIVSAKDREITSLTGTKIINVVQTDAAINPGNSGGPLLDSRGRVIGVNTMIISPSNASAGIGFAVPIDIVKKIIPQIIEHGGVKYPFHPYLGITAGNAPGLRAILIDEVVLQSGADRAGLQEGDIIVEIDGVKVSQLTDLRYILEKHEPGDTVRVGYYRDRRLNQVKVTLEAPTTE